MSQLYDLASINIPLEQKHNRGWRGLTFVGYFSVGLSKLHSTRPEKLFQESKFLKNIRQHYASCSLIVLRNIFRKNNFFGIKALNFFAFLAKRFWRVVKTTFYVSRRTLRENFSKKQSAIVYGLGAKNALTSVTKFSVGLTPN